MSTVYCIVVILGVKILGRSERRLLEDSKQALSQILVDFQTEDYKVFTWS